MKRTADISDFLQPLRDKPYQAYLSNALQVADVLDWVLRQLGKSEVWQTSFSISEEFIRRLFFIEKSGLVTKFNLVLDHKATGRQPQQGIARAQREGRGGQYHHVTEPHTR